MNIDILKKRIAIALVFLIAAMPLMYNMKAMNNQMIHATDFSIYQEAIYKISKYGDLNPYLTMRGFRIFNDHVDPIIYLSALFTKVFGYGPKNLLIFESLFYFGLIGFFLYSSKLSLKFKLYGTALILLTKGLLSGLLFPIHPSTWAMLPCFLLIYFAIRDEYKKMLIISLILITFRESFAFNLIGLSFYFLVIKKYRISFAVLGIAVSSLLITYVGRPLLLDGERINYANRLLAPYIASPLKSLMGLITELDYKAYLKVLGPFIVGFSILFKHESVDNKKLWLPIAFVLPSIGIFVLNRSIGYQYGAQVCAPLLVPILYLGKEAIFARKKALLGLLVVFLVTGVGRYTRMNKLLLLNYSKSTDTSIDKRKEYKEISNYLKDKKEIATNGMLAPGILLPHSNIYEIGYFSPKMPSYNYLFLIKPTFGDTRPLSTAFQKEMIDLCRATSEIVKDTKYFILFSKLSEKCIKKINRD